MHRDHIVKHDLLSLFAKKILSTMARYVRTYILCAFRDFGGYNGLEPRRMLRGLASSVSLTTVLQQRLGLLGFQSRQEHMCGHKERAPIPAATLILVSLRWRYMHMPRCCSFVALPKSNVTRWTLLFISFSNILTFCLSLYVNNLPGMKSRANRDNPPGESPTIIIFVYNSNSFHLFLL